MKQAHTNESNTQYSIMIKSQRRLCYLGNVKAEGEMKTK